MYELIEERGFNCLQVVLYHNGEAVAFYHSVHGTSDLNRKITELREGGKL